METVESVKKSRLRVRQATTRKSRISPNKIHSFVGKLIGDEVHGSRVLSLANGVVGVVQAAAVGVHVIGRGLAEAMSLDPKHAIKQVDRMLSNAGITIWEWFSKWVMFVVGVRKEIVVALDWTEFDKDKHSTIALYLVTSHGRATPLIWKTVDKGELKDRRNEYESDVIYRLHDSLPSDVSVTLLADRGFGDQARFEFLDVLGWQYAIRFRQGITVTWNDESKPAIEWIPKSGHAKILRDAQITREKTAVAAIVVKHQKGMKEAWCIASNLRDKTAQQIVKLYARRFTIEETFRDIKDNHFGMGLSATQIGVPARRDRLLFIAAIAQALLTMLGAAGEAVGLDRTLKANTVKTRTMSLFNQGMCWYRAIPNMREDRLRILMNAFGKIVSEHAAFSDIFGVI